MGAPRAVGAEVDMPDRIDPLSHRRRRSVKQCRGGVTASADSPNSHEFSYDLGTSNVSVMAEEPDLTISFRGVVVALWYFTGT